MDKIYGQQSNSWLEIEKAIAIEIFWLKNNIIPYSVNINLLNMPDDIFYRLIAILIVSGSIKVTEYNRHHNELKISKTKSENPHGADWHNGMIIYLYDHFLKMEYLVNKNQPPMYYGYADLMVKKRDKKIYFEIDTVSIFKLWVNLKQMKNIIIINVQLNKIIKFEI